MIELPKITAPELIVDSFAGGGGASMGIRMALGRGPDEALNHNPVALAIHRANHPETRHWCQDIWQVDPNHVTRGKPVGLLWASPDCTHFSKAKGAAPVRNAKIRDLAWSITKWAEKARPRIIIMENVQEFTTWGPLDTKGRVILKQVGATFKQWLRKLRQLGYKVEWRNLTACDYGAPTTRERFFLIARCDGQPIVWPKKTHGPGLKPVRTAAECIDWNLPCPSIFETSKSIWRQYGLRARRPLADNTLKRIARGIVKFVLEDPDPFIVKYHGPKSPNEFRGQSIHEPLKTQDTSNRHALVRPFLAYMQRAYTGHPFSGVRDADRPMPTLTAKPKGGGFALVCPSMMVNNTGHPGTKADEPMSTITTGNHQYAVAAFMQKYYGRGIGSAANEPIHTLTEQNKMGLIEARFLTKFKGTCKDGQRVDDPLHTIQAGGKHYAEVRAFLTAYYGVGVGQSAKTPMRTLTGTDRFGLVTVDIQGVEHFIVDIGLRMLRARELFRAQGFPESYIIDPLHEGKRLTHEEQVSAVGNSVCPDVAAALVAANYQETPLEQVG